ncbi:MAG: hypothetical protein ACK5NG_00330 [Chthoniobacterales bacterium]
MLLRFGSAFVLALVAAASLSADNKAEDFVHACQDATPEDLPPLVERFRRIGSKETFLKVNAFTAVSDLWLKYQNVPEGIEMPKGKISLPEIPVGYPADLTTAIKAYLHAIAPFSALQQATSNPARKLDFQPHEAEDWELIADLLTGKNGPFTEKILAYRWGGWCGTGSNRFREPQSRAILMALIADKRWPEATGAVLQTVPTRRMDGVKHVLEKIVKNPMETVAGGLAFSAFQNNWLAEQQTTRLLGLMKVLSGDERVHWLAELITQAQPNTLQAYFRVLDSLVDRQTFPAKKTTTSSLNRETGFSFGGDKLDFLIAQPLSKSAQKTALEILSAQASPELPVDAGEKLAKIFREKQIPQTEAALRRMLTHPSTTVAEAAGETLTDMGKTFTMPPKAGPLRYQLLVNGKPYANREVSWTIASESDLGSTAKTDENGILELPRDTFLDHKAIRTLALRSTKMADPNDPWFSLLIPAPLPQEAALFAITAVPLKLVLRLPKPASQFANEIMEVTLRGVQDRKNQEIGFQSPARFALPVSEKLNFLQISPGVYRMEIRIPGCITWKGNLTVKKDTAEEEITFGRASDVIVKTEPPQGWHSSAILPELWQKEKRVSADWDYEKRRFRGVPPGDYEIRIPSSKEVRKRIHGLLPDSPEFSGTNIPLTVQDDSPNIIDLKQISLQTIE